MRSITKLSLVVAALVLTGTALQAQTNNANITATANVETPINVLGAQQLSFGNVFPGVNKTVAATDLTNGGRFDVTGQASTPVTLSFTLPATLSSGGNTMPIVSYTGAHALLATQAGGVAFSPAAGANPTLSGTGALFVWVGAQVQPATNQVAGVYTGSITMTVVY
ncbi:MAG TPA: DUF4402 domain-containing protein [Gemmatimonadales bacterium]|nr:DUF4402 domain-containing protein [Gemmatimonadales bacterium]